MPLGETKSKLLELAENPITYGELKAGLNITDKAILTHLSDLKELGLIRKDAIQGKWVLTKDGCLTLQENQEREVLEKRIQSIQDVKTDKKVLSDLANKLVQPLSNLGVLQEHYKPKLFVQWNKKAALARIRGDLLSFQVLANEIFVQITPVLPDFRGYSITNAREDFRRELGLILDIIEKARKANPELKEILNLASSYLEDARIQAEKL